MGVVLASGAWFPDAFVGLVPVLGYIISQTNQGLLLFAVEVATVKCELGSRVDHFAVHIELKLLAGEVADAYWLRFSISTQMFEFTLGRSLIAIDGIQNS